MLQPVRVVALGVVLARVAAAGLPAGERRLDGGLGAVEQEAELERVGQVGVVAAAPVVDAEADARAARRSATRVAALGQQLLGAVHAALREHHLLQLGADAPPGARHRSPASRPDTIDWTDASAAASASGSGRSASSRAMAHPGAPAEDEDVEQRVRAEPVRAVDADAGHLAGRVEARGRRSPSRRPGRGRRCRSGCRPWRSGPSAGSAPGRSAARGRSRCG